MSKKQVLVRTHDAGVHFGYLRSKEYTPAGVIVVLEKARRIWAWAGAKTLNELATLGTREPDDCEFSMPVPTQEIIVNEVIDFTEKGWKSVNDVPYWKDDSSLSREDIDKIVEDAIS